MAKHEAEVDFVFEATGADKVRKEFDSIADAVQAGQASFKQLEKVIKSVESSAPRLARSLRATAAAIKGGFGSGQADPRLSQSYENHTRQVREETRALREQQEVREALYDLERQSAAYSSAKKQTDEDQAARQVGSLTAARQRLAEATKRQADAEREIAQAQRNLQTNGATSSNIQSLANAYRNYSLATKDATRATRDISKAQNEQMRSQRNIENQMATARHSMYDLSQTYAILGGTMAGVGVYATVMGAQFESAFTNVERTVDPAGRSIQEFDSDMGELRQSLIQMQGQIPLTFTELSQIATLGNQLGIAEEDVLDFTGTIARFSNVSGMSIDAVSQAFGGFMAQTGLAPKYLENLGSALAYVSVNSNATEEQILSVSKEIAAIAAGSGLAADQIVGLAGAMSSLQIAPERARGSLETYFATLNRAVANGGADLQNFATVVGVTSEKLTEMVRSGQGAEVFTGFLEGLQDFDSVGVTLALDELGLAQLRVTNSMRRLSTNVDSVKEHMSDAQQAFISGSELNRQYSMTLDDLSSQWTIFINGLNSVISTISGDAIPGLAGLLQLVNRLVYGFQEWLQGNPWAKYIIAFGGALVTVMGVMVLVNALVFRARSAMLNFRLATAQAASAGISAVGSFRGMAGALVGVNATARGAAAGLRTFRTALASTGLGIAVVGLGFVAEKFLGMQNSADDAALSMNEYNKMLYDAQSATGGAGDASAGLADELGGSGGVADSAGKAAEAVRTLVDYVGDLEGILSRSFDLRFGTDSAFDAILDQVDDMNKRLQDAKDAVADLKIEFRDAKLEVQKARDEIRSLKADLKGISADLSHQKYLLEIAIDYGDTAGAEKIQANIAKLEAERAEKTTDLKEAQNGLSDAQKDVVDTQKKLKDAQKALNAGLTGNSKASRENRQDMRDLVKAHQDYITTLIENGASQKDVDQAIKDGKQAIYDQGAAMGYTRSEVDQYASALDDTAKIVARFPSDVTIGFNTDPATQALNEFFAKAKEQASAAGPAMADALGGGFGDAMDGLDFDDMLDPFADSVKEVTEEGASTWDKFWWNAGHLAIRGIASIVEPLWGAQEAIKALFAGEDVGAAWERGIAEAGVLVRDQFGAIGFMGAEALETEFKRGNKPGEWIADGITYAWDPVAREMSRVGAVGVDEWRARMEEAGKLVGPVIVDGINWAKDPITGEIYKVGEESTATWNSTLLERLDPTIIAQKVAEGKELSNQEARTLAKSMGLEYNSVLNNNADPIGKILNKIQSGKSLTAKEARTLANADADAYNRKFGLSLDIDGKISGEFGGVKSDSARSAGTRSGNSFWGGVQAALNGFGDWISDLFNPKPSIGSRAGGRKGGSYASGGYTGPGHWLQPAGVVHRGEYVIPKKYVNQQTGLPDANYVASLQRGKSAPKGSYASGGYVSGGMSDTVNLSARTIQELARVVKTEIALDGKIVGESASRSYAASNRVGAN